MIHRARPFGPHARAEWGMRRELTHGYELDDDPARVDLDALTRFLTTQAYWGRWRTRATIERQLGRSWRVLGLYLDGAMVGFARAVSDGEAYAYLADVYVEEAHRGGGRGTELVREIVEGEGADAFRWALHTRDAHGLYARFGFAPPDATLLERPAPPERRHGQ